MTERRGTKKRLMRMAQAARQMKLKRGKYYEKQLLAMHRNAVLEMHRLKIEIPTISHILWTQGATGASARWQQAVQGALNKK